MQFLKYLQTALKRVAAALAIYLLIWLVGIVSVSILLATMTSFNLSVWDWMLMSFKDPRTMLFVSPVAIALFTSWHAHNKKKKR